MFLLLTFTNRNRYNMCMNINNLNGTSKLIKKIQSYSNGQTVVTGDIPNIAIINSVDVPASKNLVDNVKLGVHAAKGNAAIFNVAGFGYLNKINPMTAKYAESFRKTAASNAEAILKTNMIDGAVIVTDCDITAAGILLGCLRANVPALILPTGTAKTDFENLRLSGSVRKGKINAQESEEQLSKTSAIHGQSEQLNSVSSFFMLCETVGLAVRGASANPRNSGLQLRAAAATGEQIVSMAKDLLSPKKFLTKDAAQKAANATVATDGDIGAFDQFAKLLTANDVKLTDNFFATAAGNMTKPTKIVFAKGTVCESSYIQYSENTPGQFSGKAWVYPNLEDADKALLSGSISEGVVVVHNCVDINITALAYTIEGLERADKIALATDGYCDKTSVLTVTLARPSSFDNEEFANIQTSDHLEIDLARGRFNTSVLAKDQKLRAKRNTTPKPTTYFN